MTKRNASVAILFGITFIVAVSLCRADLTYTDNLLGWYSAGVGTYTTATGTTPSGNGDPVGRWEDQSGNNYHLRRITGASTPTLQTSAGPLGTPALSFDGSDYLMLSGDGTAGTIQYFPTATTIGTAFIVFKPNAEVTAASPTMVLTTFNVNFTESITLGAQTSLITDEIIAARKRQWIGTSWQNTATGVSNDGGARSISNAEYTFLNVTHGVNTFDIRFAMGGDSLTDLQNMPTSDPFGPHTMLTTAPAVTNATPTTQLTLQLGNASSAPGYLNGHMVEILLYTTALNNTQRAEVEDYLSAKYVIPEPGTLSLIGLGLMAVWYSRRRVR